MKENVERCGGHAVHGPGCLGDRGRSAKARGRARRPIPTRKLSLSSMPRPPPVCAVRRAALCALAHKHDCLAIVDAVTSLAGIDRCKSTTGRIDAVYSGTQKCLSCVPGIAPITFSERAWNEITGRKPQGAELVPRHELVMGYWGGRPSGPITTRRRSTTSMPCTKRCSILQEEGLEQSWQRHRHNHHALVAGLEAMGLFDGGGGRAPLATTQLPSLFLRVPTTPRFAAACCNELRSRDRRRARRAGRQDLAYRPDGPRQSTPQRALLPERTGIGSLLPGLRYNRGRCSAGCNSQAGRLNRPLLTDSASSTIDRRFLPRHPDAPGKRHAHRGRQQG